MAFCKIQFIGNLGRDPEMRYTPSGRPVTEFSVAVNQATRNQQTNEWVEATDWFRVSVWGDRAERAAEQLRKGSRVFVDGRFRSREYETKDGRKGVSLDVTADSVVGLDRREEQAAFGAAAAAGGPTGGSTARPPAIDDTEIDELPF